MKGDHIDIALCDFLNNYKDRDFLKVRFIRENEGVYTFGTKKIFVKLLDTGLKIRVGGGYLNIEEFLEQFTPIELEKIAQKHEHLLAQMAQEHSQDMDKIKGQLSLKTLEPKKK